MAKSPETSGSSDGGKSLHSIEEWGVLDLGDWEISPEYAIELRRRYEQKHPGEHLSEEQFTDWLRVLSAQMYTETFQLTPDQEEELRRQYDQPFPGQEAEASSPEEVAPDARPDTVPPDGPDAPPLD